MYYPKQRQLTINREKVERTSGNKFLCVYEDSIKTAYKELTKSAFQVWLYLICNKDKYNTEYSTTHISQITDMSVETARKAFLELEKKCYIIPKNDSKVFYNFYERPQTVDYVIDEETGEIIHYKDKKQFYDEYIDGRKDYYVMTFEEVLYGCSCVEEALELWRGEI